MNNFKTELEFPSPLRVSFFLIIETKGHWIIGGNGFRLLSEYHFFLYEEKDFNFEPFERFPSPLRVSFFLMLYTQQYGDVQDCFRLLSEYHFFLYSLNKPLILSYIILSFS